MGVTAGGNRGSPPQKALRPLLCFIAKLALRPKPPPPPHMPQSPAWQPQPQPQLVKPEAAPHTGAKQPSHLLFPSVVLFSQASCPSSCGQAALESWHTVIPLVLTGGIRGNVLSGGAEAHIGLLAAVGTDTLFPRGC